MKVRIGGQRGVLPVSHGKGLLRGLGHALVGLALLLALVGALPGRSEAAGAIVNPAGCRASALAVTDDGSSGVVPLGFTINFFGTDYDSLSVNNNGNVTFDGPMSTYQPFDMVSSSRVLIAPFFDDVDLEGRGR